MPKALIFSGQGAQEVGMGQSLYEQSATARAIYDQADSLLGWSLTGVSFSGPESELTRTSVCQPALFVMGVALTEILRERGGLDDVVAAFGLSLGELTGLTVAGSFSFEDGLRAVARRGELMQAACEATDGAMASMIGGTREAVLDLCARFDVDAANFNAPGQIVISGERANVEAAAAAAGEGGAFRMVVPLTVAGAYHSRLMASAGSTFASYLQEVEIRTPDWTVYSNTTGEPLGDPDSIRAALAKQVSSPVLWEDCMRRAFADGVTEFFECGPRKVLSGLARRTERSWSVTSLGEWEDVERLEAAVGS